MTHSVRGFGLATNLVFVSTLGVVPQANAQNTAAYVYVQSQGAAGPVYGYNANPNGYLTAIPGSPFKPGTAIVGGNGTQFFTIGHTYLHSWAVGSNGAIGSQLSDVEFVNYSGGSCAGSQDGDATGVLDHTGKYVYLVLQSGSSNPGGDTCEAYQSYLVNNGGAFTFEGDAETNSLSGTVSGLPSIPGNESFAYAETAFPTAEGGESDILGLQRETSSSLEVMVYNETDPTLSGGSYALYNPDGDPVPGSNFLVIQLYPNHDTTKPLQLASYTVDSQGNIASSNTQSNMPTSALYDPFPGAFSPDGKLYALYARSEAQGIEIYNFNGASPLTLSDKILTGTPINQVAWDSSGHLYAISRSENKMWVFNVTSNSVSQAEVINVTTPVSIAVVSQATSSGSCSAPASPGVNVCSPANGATVTSPVQINAVATVSGGVYRFEVWNGSTKLLSGDSGTINQTVSLAAGSYTLKFDAYNSGKTSHEYATRDITVK